MEFSRPIKRVATFQAIFIIVLASFVVYFNTVFNGFVYDDFQNILQNPWIRNVKHIGEIFTSHVAGFDNNLATSFYRPLMHIINMGNYFVFGLNPWGYHLVNIFFHACVSVLVFLITYSVLRKTESPVANASFSPALFSALLFATHPIHTESVAWLAGITDISFTFFFLLAFYLYIRAAERNTLSKGFYLLSLSSFFLSTLCKEPALLLPAILIVYDYIFGELRTRPVDYLKRYAPYILVAGVYFLLRFYALGGFAPSKNPYFLDKYQYFINFFPLFMKYLSMLILPRHLTLVYVFHPAASIYEIKCLISMFFSAVFFALALIAWRKKVLFFSFVIFFIPLLPAFYVISVSTDTVFAERYLYLPSFGFVVIVALCITWAKSKIHKATAIFTALSIALITAYSLGTVSRNAVWKDGYSLWTDTVEKSPDSPIAHQYLGEEFYSQGRFDDAIEEYLGALRLNPRLAYVYVSLGAAYAQKGFLDLAIEHLQTAIRLSPRNHNAHYNLGFAFGTKGWLDLAIKEYEIATEINPLSAEAHNALGIAYADKGLIAKAIEEFQTATRLNPNDPIYYDNLSKALSK